ncbi:MAG: helix-turn-helix domain-containing protein, partial [Parvularcula sp.]|nr:helix-turn-helix domain-containing protein [Parvularcula sp.]
VILYDQTSSTPIVALDGTRARYLEGSTAKSIAQSFHDVDLEGLSDEAVIALPDLDVANFYNAKVYPLQIGRLTAGGLIVGDADRSDPFDALNLQEARFAAATLLMKSLTQSREQQETLSDLLLTIFSGNWRNADALRSRGRRLGLDLAKPQVFFAVRGSSSATDAERHSEYQALARSCQRLGKEPAIIREGAVYLIMLSVADASDEKIDIWANHFLREMTPIWGRQVFIIVSSTCADLADYANARREIDDAFNVLEAIPRSGIVRTSAFDGTGLLLACSGHQRIETFLNNTLGPIWDAEKGNSAETLTTIRTYLESGCRFSTSAEALGIHVTTMRYRIERIKDQFGIDFSDRETRFEFDLAMRLYDFRYPTKA